MYKINIKLCYELKRKSSC